MAFQGYTQQTVDFMWGIRFNNERGWFLEHKDDYINTFLTPTRELGEQVYDAVHALLPDEPLMLKVSRIYRDARRLLAAAPIRITCGGASAPATRTGRAAPPSGLSWGRITTASVWVSGRLPPR